SATLLEHNPGLLLGGLWGTARIRYSPEVDGAAPNELMDFTPFQVGPPDVAGYRERRRQFTTDECMGLMLQSAAYAPQSFATARPRFLLLARLVPWVEATSTLAGLGPRRAGKPFLRPNVSPVVFPLPGERPRAANLFVNLATKAVGILGTRKVVVFD